MGRPSDHFPNITFGSGHSFHKSMPIVLTLGNEDDHRGGDGFYWTLVSTEKK